jgi:hypothetical protein
MVERYRGRRFASKHSPAQGTNAHTVGYGRPPRDRRFAPGQSGNPKGRPSGLLNLKTDLTRELNSLITVRTGNRTVRVKKGKAWLMKVVNGALNNDAKATATLVQLILRLDLIGPTQTDGEAPLTSNDQELLADWLQRHLGDFGQGATEAGSAPSDSSQTGKHNKTSEKPK